MSIVVVQELQSSVDIIVQSLHKLNHDVFGFTDSAEALKFIIEAECVSIVFTGLNVTPLNGVELCWSLKSQIVSPRFIHLIALSSHKDGDALGEALDGGADDFLTTPINTNEMRARLRAAQRLIELQKTLAKEAHTDPLTGLPNRRGLRHAMQSLSRNTSGYTTIAILDIDFFKRVNDTFGHDAGDRVIQGLAKVVTQEGAIIARVGGEEFVIAIPDATPSKALCELNRLRKLISDHNFKAQNTSFNVTCSFGATLWHHKTPFDAALKLADVTLYRAKANGRNRIEFDPGYRHGFPRAASCKVA